MNKAQSAFRALISRVEAEAAHRKAVQKLEAAVESAALAQTKLNSAREAIQRAEQSVRQAETDVKVAELALSAEVSKAADEFFKD